MKPLILNYSRKYKSKFKENPFFYNNDKEISESINNNSICDYDSNYIIYATGSYITEANTDPTRDEAMDRS